jgi:thiol-disulfide isomerase/thioredoxin
LFDKKDQFIMKEFLIRVILFIGLLFATGLAQSGIKVETLDKGKLNQIIENRQGKILFLNLWATWCAPCREEFPDIVKLASQNKNKNVEFIGISIDYPEEIKSKIIPFLKSKKANFKNYVNGIKGDEELINILNVKWNGALPATFVYNEAGKQIVFLEGKHSFEDFEKALQ